MSFRKISCTGAVRTKDVVKSDFVHRGCEHAKHHQDRFNAQGLCARIMSFRQISCTGIVRTKNVVKTDFIYTGVVRTKSVVRTNFVHRGSAHEKRR